MVRHIDVVLIGPDVLASVNANARANCPGYQATPPPRAPMLHSSLTIKRPEQKRDRRHHYRVEIPEQVGERSPQINQNCFQLLHSFELVSVSSPPLGYLLT